MMPFNADSAIRSAGLAAVAAPLALALAARFGLGGPPPEATAAPDTPSPRRELAAPLPILSPEQERIRQYAHQALAQPFATSPMHRLAPEPPVEPTQSVAAPIITEPATPTFNVSAVIVGSRQSLATINGELRRIGDEVAPGWRLASIDAAQGVLIIIGDNDQRVEVSIRQMVR